MSIPGADPGFQGRRGALKKNCPERREALKFLGYFVWKNYDFTQKKSYFFQLRKETRKFVGYFVWKITILRQHCQKYSRRSVVTFRSDSKFKMAVTFLDWVRKRRHQRGNQNPELEGKKTMTKRSHDRGTQIALITGWIRVI